MESMIGRDIVRKEAFHKVTGAAKYMDDFIKTGMYHVELLISPHAHATILSIDISDAMKGKGVKAILTGNDVHVLCGALLEDRPPLAKGKVRYFGEPVAMVIADCEQNAKASAEKIKIQYAMLPVVNSIADALKENPVILHENLMQYKKPIVDIYPEENTNICNRTKIRKGDMQKGWNDSEVIVKGDFLLPQSDHAAMETRTAQCEIRPDGQVILCSSSQSPFSVRKHISEYFNIPEGNIIVQVPLVGGGFGGKSSVQMEILAYLASKAVDGHAIKVVNNREKDMVTSPCHLGLEAKLKIGANRSGKITAAEMYFYLDCGGYSGMGPRMAKAIAADCGGPYHIENLFCDALCVYTNHPYVAPFRGFGHESHAFCLERMMDKLAFALNIDPMQIRLINKIKAGDFTPTQTKVTLSNTGNFGECLTKLKNLIHWDEGQKIAENTHLVRAKGLGCFCKTSSSPTNAVSGVFLTFNTDGSINLNCGVVEYGPGMKTTAAQILAERMKMDIGRIHVQMDVDTQANPEHWKTVASMTTFMLGKAILRAADDLMQQILNIAGSALKCAAEDLEVENEKVFLKGDPEIYIAFTDIVHGYQYPNGNAIGGQILGRGSFIMSHLTFLDKETGKGKSGPYWTVGAQAVEIEYDTIRHTYRILKAATVVDAGRVLNPKTARGVIMGGMCMGLGLGMSEAFVLNHEGAVQNTSFRTYKMMRFGENPDYLIDFVETPNIEAPYGIRGLAEHGTIGIAGALANAVSLAAQIDITELPITPESIWRKKTGAQP